MYVNLACSTSYSTPKKRLSQTHLLTTVERQDALKFFGNTLT